MSHLQVDFWPGATQEQYEATLKVVHSNELPPGQLTHAAGPCEGGFLISATWDSKESSDTFVQQTLTPALPIDEGMSGPPVSYTA
ncbi:MAG: hypothetical protein ACRDPG_13535 [Nocardioidaceae bacterium]